MISFAGYAPLENPQILVTIIVDEPDLGGNYHLGGDVAAPAFKEIVSQTLRYMGIAPNTAAQQHAQAAEQKMLAAVPDLTSLSLDQARKTMDKFGISVAAIGQGAGVIAQYPAPGTEIGGLQRMYVMMQETKDVPVPDMTGKSLRDAIGLCSFLKLRCQSEGEGYVTSQTLEAPGKTGCCTCGSILTVRRRRMPNRRNRKPTRTMTALRMVPKIKKIKRSPHPRPPTAINPHIMPHRRDSLF